MKQNLFLRHMQTRYNVSGILQGRRDIPIIPPGPDLQVTINENIKQIGPASDYTHILVSSLKRTWMTAELYVNTYTIEPLLDELDFGEWEGKKKEEMIRALPLWTERPDLLTLGEPLSNLEKRVRTFMKKYDSAQSILVFGHGAWIRALLSVHRSNSIRDMNKIIVPNNKLFFL